MKTVIEEHDFLLVVDIQNDFCTGGALAVPGADDIVPVTNRLMGLFPHVGLTQDWHPADHYSFATAHPGHVPFETIELPYGQQVLWPDHCVQGKTGAEFHEDLNAIRAEFIVRKGFRREIDSYSAFFENDRTTPTGLTGYLRERGFRRLFLAGLATDYCVRYSAEDARQAGFDVVVIEDACRAIDLEGSLDQARSAIIEIGAVFALEAELRV